MLLLVAVFFVFLALVVSCAGYFLWVKPAISFDRVLKASDFTGGPNPRKRTLRQKFSYFFGEIGRRLPASTQGGLLLKKELHAAGFKSQTAIAVFSGVRIAVCALFLLLGLALRGALSNPLLHLLSPFMLLALGYVAPGFMLGRLIDKRKERIRLGLADALDLLVVSSEAGCSLDQGILNVSREFKTVHPELAEEFSTINFEILAGSSRASALRNFATRTGEDEVRKLVAILIQADRFGTSIADALRTQGQYMRVRRHQAAEERAAKVGVKLVFPIFFFFMPSLVVLVAGPGMIQIVAGFANLNH